MRAGRDAAPAGRSRKPTPGTPRVTVRPYYGGLPFSGLDGAGRREAKASRIRVGGAPPSGPGSYGPGVQSRRGEAPQGAPAGVIGRWSRTLFGTGPTARRATGCGVPHRRLTALHPLGLISAGRRQDRRPGAGKQKPRSDETRLQNNEVEMKQSANRARAYPSSRKTRGGWPSGGDSRTRPGGVSCGNAPPPGRSLRSRPPSPCGGGKALVATSPQGREKRACGRSSGARTSTSAESNRAGPSTGFRAGARRRPASPRSARSRRPRPSTRACGRTPAGCRSFRRQRRR